ncbi:MAG: hypothetical protein KA780_06140 [Prolixibacteraceae bacterium]|nr:hypothetical protein [Prolixibacteraceae bacterium]
MFFAVTLIESQTLAIQPYTATPINGSNNSSNRLTAGTVIAIKTNTGRFAKMKIDSYGYNLGIPWDAPGFLPPDPPPGIREMVQEWEKKMNESDGNG